MILVTDASGLVGHALLHRLAAEKREARCILQPSRREQRLPTGILFGTVSASLSDLPALRTAMQDVTTVIHLSAEENPDQLRRLPRHAEDTANLIAAAKEAGISRLIYLSRIGADRSSAYPLFRARGEAEAVVRQSGLDYTILRSAITYGRNDRFTTVITMAAKSIPFFLPVPSTEMSHFQPVWVADLITCVLDSIDRKDLFERTIPIGGPEHFTLEQMVVRILRAARVRRRLVTVGMPMMRRLVSFTEAILPHSPVPSIWLDVLAVGSTTDLVTIPRHFDFQPGRFEDHLDYLRERRPWRRQFLRLILTGR